MIPHAAIRNATARFKPFLLRFGDRLLSDPNSTN
jgi:hypothetical protein